MRKEVIFAILIGAVFGIAIVLGVRRLNTNNDTEPRTANNNVTEQPENETPTSTQDDTNAEEIFIATSSPIDKSVITSTPVTITGLTLSNSWVVMISDDEEMITQANSSGEFNFDVELSGGLNQLKLVAMDLQGNQAAEEINLVFTTQLE